MKSILDPSFRYTSSVNTNLAKTFARVRLQMKAVAAQREATRAAEKPDMTNVLRNFEERRKGAKP